MHKLHIECLNTKGISESERRRLVEMLANFSKEQVQKISAEYLAHRLSKYNLLALAWIKDSTNQNISQLIGFGFSNLSSVKAGIQVPWIHCGLMIVNRAHRGQRVSSKLTRAFVREAARKHPVKTRTVGIFVTAKCSSPISFMRLQIGSYRLGFPRITSRNNFDLITRSPLLRALSQRISSAMGFTPVSDFLLRGANENSGFLLSQETYENHSPFQKQVIEFFQKNVLPNNELLFVTWCPAIGLWHK